MDKNGFVSIHRKIQDNWLWSDKPFSKGQAWIDLLLLARWKDEKKLHRGKLYDRKRGEVNYSMTWLAERWGWSRNKVRRFMRTLEEQHMVRVNATTNDTSITIENYSIYQDVRTTDDTTHDTTHDTTDDTQMNKDNKDNKDNNPPISPQRGARGGRSRKKPRNEVWEMLEEELAKNEQN